MHYINLPPYFNLSSELPDTFIISLSGTGWKFISGNLFSDLDHLTIDLSFLNRQSANNITYPTSHFVRRITELNSSNIKILHIEPDSLRFSFTENFTVKVPVISQAEVTCQKQYMVIDKIKVIPDSIEIFGSRQAISGITAVKTDPIKLDLLTESVDTMVSFHLPQGLRSKFKKQQVRLIIPVSEYAELKFAVPVKPPADLSRNLKFYPDSAMLTVRLPITKVKSFSPSDFSVSAETPPAGSGFAKIVCDKLPSGTVLFNLEPPFVECYKLN